MAPVAAPRKVSWDGSRNWSEVFKPKEEEQETIADGVMSKTALLAARSLALKENPSPSMYDLHTLSSTIVSERLCENMPSAPPGLAPPPGLEFLAEGKPVAEEPIAQAVEEQEEHQVILTGLPEKMLQASVLPVMLEQAKLKDIRVVELHLNAALITFNTYASAQKCINHFSCCTWAPGVRASYVRLTEDGDEPVIKQVEQPKKQEPTAAPAQKGWSVDAPAFVPAAVHYARYYGYGPMFMPAWQKASEARDRFYSYASTDVGAESGLSEDVDSEEEQVSCA